MQLLCDESCFVIKEHVAHTYLRVTIFVGLTSRGASEWQVVTVIGSHTAS